MRQVTFPFNGSLTRQDLNQRFADLASGSILQGFRLKKGTGFYSVSVSRDGVGESILLTKKGVRLTDDGDAIDAIRISPNTTTQDRYDVVYVIHDPYDKTFYYEAVEGITGESVKLIQNPELRTAIGHVRVRPNQTLIQADLTSYPIGLRIGTSLFEKVADFLEGIKTKTLEIDGKKAASEEFATSQATTKANTALTDAKAYADTQLNAAKTYTSTQLNALIGGAPGTLDTLKEIADALGNDAQLSSKVIETRTEVMNARGAFATLKERMDFQKYYVDVKEFGAKGDGVTDDTAAIQAAVNASGVVFFSKGTYVVSDTINCRNKWIIGSGTMSVIITSIATDENKPIFSIGGVSILEGMIVEYSNSVMSGYVGISGARGKRVVLRTHDTGNMVLNKTAIVRDVQLRNCGTGISDGGMGCFSVSFLNVQVKDFFWTGVDMYSQNRTGNVWNNIYINGIGDKYLAASGFVLEGEESEVSIDQLNLEHFSGNSALLLSNVRGLKIGTVHIEGVSLRSAWKGFVDLNQVSGEIAVATFYFTRHPNMGSHLFRLRESGFSTFNATATAIKNEESKISIGTLVCKGLNRPDAGIYPTYPSESKTLTNAASFSFFFRDSTLTGTYRVKIESYNWATYTGISDDSSIYKNFPSDVHNKISFDSKGDNKTQLFVSPNGTPYHLTVDNEGVFGESKPQKMSSLPVASVSLRGRMIRIEGATNVADALYICMKKADNTYAWIQLY